jgi:nucleotide-binding universal stress UspA family protein
MTVDHGAMPARQQLDPGDPVIAALALRDDDDAVLALADRLAGVIGSPLALVHAYPFQTLISLPSPPEWAVRMRDEAVDALERTAQPLRERRTVTVHVKANPAQVRALHEAAEELHASVVVAGSSHRGRAGRVVPGGVGERLLHAAPCVVAIAPRGYEAPPEGVRRIGVAYNDGPEGAAAMALAGRLAELAGARVSIYTVAGGDAAEAAVVLERAALAVPPARLAGTTILHGDPAPELARASESLDLLIAGSRGYGPVRSLVVGGVSAELAHSARCPLLIVPRASIA